MPLYDVIPEEIAIGSRVRVIKDSDGEVNCDGFIGTVICFDTDLYRGDGVGVDLDNCKYSSIYGWPHDLDGRLADPTGRYFSTKDLDLIFE